MYVYKLLKQFYVLFKRKFYRFVQRLFLIIITCPNSIVRLTSLYFIPLDSGGLCHQVSIPSTANSGDAFYRVSWDRICRNTIKKNVKKCI